MKVIAATAEEMHHHIRRIMKRDRMLKTFWNVQHRNGLGELLWEEKDIPNILHDDGSRHILANSFKTGDSFAGVPSNDYIGLRSNSAAETDTLSSGLTELGAVNGYARNPVSTTTGFALSLISGGYKATSGNVVFTNSAAVGTNAWTAAVALFLATTIDNTGKLISSAALSTSRTLLGQDTLTVSCFISMSG